MNTDDHYVYVFIRQDLPIPLQLVHACHAVYCATRTFRPDDGIPSMVLIGVPDLPALNRVSQKCRDRCLSWFAWYDPDNPDKDDLLAISTAPLNHTQRNYLKNYRLYADVAQLREHSVVNGEVAAPAMESGVNPAVGSTT